MNYNIKDLVDELKFLQAAHGNIPSKMRNPWDSSDTPSSFRVYVEEITNEEGESEPVLVIEPVVSDS